MKIAVLGAGMVGRAIATDLAAFFNVTSFDVSADSLRKLHDRDSRIHTVRADLQNFNNYSSGIYGL